MAMSTPPPSDPGAPPSEPSSTSPPSHADGFSDDGAEDNEAGALQLLLAALGLAQYLPSLVELGAEQPADIELVSEGELQEIGMKPIQARKLLRAVQLTPAAPVQPPPATTSPVQGSQQAVSAPELGDTPKPLRTAKARKRNVEQPSKSTRGTPNAKATVPPPAGEKKKKKKKKGKVATEEPPPEPEETGQLVGDEFTLTGFPSERYNGLHWQDKKLPIYNNCPHYISATGMHIYFDDGRGQRRWVLADRLQAATAVRPVAVLKFDHVTGTLPLGTNRWNVVDQTTGNSREHRVKLCRARTQVDRDTSEVFAQWQQPDRSSQAGTSQGAQRIKQAIMKAGLLHGENNGDDGVLSPVDVDAMAKYIGVDVIEHPSLRCLVDEYLRAPIPPGWEEWYNARHGVMYYSCNWPATCSWHHPYEDYYRHLLQRLTYLSTEAAALRAENQQLLSEQMQSRYNLLRARHETTVDKWMAEETEMQREVRSVRYSTFFRAEMDRRETAASTLAPVNVFQGTSKQLSTWRRLGERTPDISRCDRMIEQTRVIAGGMHELKGLTQGGFLQRITDQKRTRYDAATNIQRIARSMRPRKLLLQAQTRRIKEELAKNARLNAIALKVMKRMAQLFLAQCVSQWAEWTSKMSSARALMQQVANSRQEQFFQLWLMFMEEAKHAKRQMNRANAMAMRLMQQMLAKCIRHWSEWVAKVLAAMQMAQQVQGALNRQCFEYWIHYLRLRKEDAHHQRQAQSFVLRMQMQVTTKCVHRWMNWARRMSRVNWLLQQYLVGMQQRCFDAWVYLREERVRKDEKNRAAANMVIRMLKQTVGRCVQAWRTWATKVHSAREMACHLEGGYMRVCLYEWLDRVYRRKEKTVKLKLAEKFAIKTSSGVALVCVQHWSEWMRKVHASRQMLQKMRDKALAKIMYEWRGWAADRRDLAGEFERRSWYMHNKRVVRTSRRCWVAWRQRAYVRWLSCDYYSFLQRRRQKEELRAWARWARACKRAETGFRHRKRDQFRAMLQHWRRWAVRKFAARTEINRKLQREVEKARAAAVIAAHHFERRMGATSPNVEARERGNGTHHSSRTSARPYLDAVQMTSLGDLPVDARNVLQLQQRAEVCRSHLEKANQGLVHPKVALATLHSLTGSPPNRQAAAPKLPPVSASDHWHPTPRAGKQDIRQPDVSGKYLVPGSTAAQQYSVLAKKAVVRIDADPESALVEELPRGTVVTGTEEKLVAGHARIRIGDGRWVSKVTAKGKVLLEALDPQP